MSANHDFITKTIKISTSRRSKSKVKDSRSNNEWRICAKHLRGSWSSSEILITGAIKKKSQKLVQSPGNDDKMLLSGGKKRCDRFHHLRTRLAITNGAIESTIQSSAVKQEIKSIWEAKQITVALKVAVILLVTHSQCHFCRGVWRLFGIWLDQDEDKDEIRQIV